MDDSDVSVCGNKDYISRRKISFYFKQKWDIIIKVDNDGRACGGCGDPYEGRPGPQDREAASD